MDHLYKWILELCCLVRVLFCLRFFATNNRTLWTKNRVLCIALGNNLVAYEVVNISFGIYVAQHQSRLFIEMSPPHCLEIVDVDIFIWFSSLLRTVL